MTDWLWEIINNNIIFFDFLEDLRDTRVIRDLETPANTFDIKDHWIFPVFTWRPTGVADVVKFYRRGTRTHRRQQEEEQEEPGLSCFIGST